MPKSQYDSIAEEYDLIRPSYPLELFEQLVNATHLNMDSRLLEIGAGTGKATIPLAEKGYSIDCIEIEQQMANILLGKCKNLPRVSVTVDNFETWENRNNDNYSLVFCAQAFHWINENIRYKKCYELIRSGGYLGLMWYISIIDSMEQCDLLNKLFQKYDVELSYGGIEYFNNFVDGENNRINRSPYFINAQQFIYEGPSQIQNADMFISRFNTTSAYSSLEESTKTRINKELHEIINGTSGVVNSRLMYILLVSEKA